MTKTTIVSWKTSKNQTLEVKIVVTREVRDNIADADGYKVDLGKETYENTEMTITLDGKFVAKTTWIPRPATEADKKRLPAGAYAVLAQKVILTEENYNKLMDAINTLNTEIETETTTEYAEVKATEEAKEAAEKAKDEAEERHYQKLVKSGLCPKCGTWCYGNCE